MSHVFYDQHQIHRDDRLVFDHQYRADNRVFHFATRKLDEIGRILGRHIHDVANLSGAEALNGVEQQRFAAVWRQPCQVTLCTRR